MKLEHLLTALAALNVDRRSHERLNLTTASTLIAIKIGAGSPTRPSMTALAKLSGVSTAAMTGTRDRLAAMGLVTDGVLGANDRRAIGIALTPKGEALVNGIAFNIADIEKEDSEA